MRILIISQVLPYPPVYEGATGAMLKMYYMVKHLSRRGHKITVISFFRDAKELDYIDEAKQFCENIYPVFEKNQNKLIFRVAGTLLINKPLPLIELYSPDMVQTIKNVINEVKIL